MAERIEDFNLPNAVIARLVKEALPDGVNVSKEAKTVLTRAASVFSLYATSCANSFAMKAKRKTLTAADVLNAVEDMEFEKFLEPMNQSLEAFRREKANKSTKRKSSKSGDASVEIDEDGDDFKEASGNNVEKVDAFEKSLDMSEDLEKSVETNEEMNFT